ncbi:MAG TPA: hypothetical protein VM266_01850 [Solirubrobacteraceae bacterium]|nr:hypothetical protein [Solirubrobacteraceae bacterium]
MPARGALAALLTLLALACAPATAGAAGLETVLQDDAQLLHRPEDQLRRSLQEMKALGVDRIRVTAGWSVLTRDPDAKARPAFDATNPAAYEQERWRNLDRLVVLAREYGFKTMIDIAFWAPHWASQDAPGQRGRTEVDAEAFAQFTAAVARRYSGTFVIPRTSHHPSGDGPFGEGADARYLRRNFGTSSPDSGVTLLDALGIPAIARGGESAATLGDGAAATLPLPKVDLFTLWNEPNHPSFMRPQWARWGKGYVPRSPHVYRAMVYRGHAALKAVRPDAAVLVGGTSFEGTSGRRGTGGVPPLRFLRELACVDRRLQPIKRFGCSDFRPIPGDGWAHHPYTLRTKPNARARGARRDDVPIADLPRLAKLLDRLIAAGRLAPGVRNLWVTEYGYETNPPVEGWIFSPYDQARFLTWAEFLASRVPTNRSYAQFLLRDLPPGAFKVNTSKKRAFGQWQSGLLHDDGTPKVSVYSFRAGLFVQRRKNRRLLLWGRLRLGHGITTIAIERRAPGSRKWRTIFTQAPGQGPTDRFTVSGTDAFQRYADAPRRRASGYRYRLRYLDGDHWQSGLQVAAVGR